MNQFPQYIMPDGKSGIFSVAACRKDAAGLENAADTAKGNGGGD